MSKELQTHAACSSEDFLKDGLKPNVVTRLATYIKRHLSSMKKRQQDRVAIQQLAELNDRQLRDIGITHDDLYSASRLRDEQTKYLELRRLSRSTPDMRSNF